MAIKIPLSELAQSLGLDIQSDSDPSRTFERVKELCSSYLIRVELFDFTAWLYPVERWEPVLDRLRATINASAGFDWLTSTEQVLEVFRYSNARNAVWGLLPWMRQRQEPCAWC